MRADPNLRWRLEQLVVRFGALPFPRSQESVIAEMRSLWGVGLDPKDEINELVEALLRAGVLVPTADDTWNLDLAALKTWAPPAHWNRGELDPLNGGVEIQLQPSTVVVAVAQAAGKATVGPKSKPKA